MPNKERLVDLAMWLGGQQALKDLGLPSEWDQVIWVDKHDIKVNGSAEFSCGTACCAAGRTAIAAGGQPVFYVVALDESYAYKRWEDMTSVQRKAITNGNGYAEDSDGNRAYAEASDEKMVFPRKDGTFEIQGIEGFAADYLGLNEDQANALFGGHNEYEHMIYLIKQYLREADAEAAAMAAAAAKIS